MSQQYEIPENYDVRKILEALIRVLVDKEILEGGIIRTMIIEKGKPEQRRY